MGPTRAAEQTRSEAPSRVYTPAILAGEYEGSSDRAASGAAAYQLVVFSGEEIRTIDLPAEGEVTIGRGEASAVRIDDPSVSRSHAVLRVGPTLEIEDLGGAGGIFLREKPRAGVGNDTLQVGVRQLVRRKSPLAVGDSVLFGTTSVVLRHAPKLELPDLDAPAVPKMGAGIVVRDPAMRALYEQAARAARAQISIL